MSVTGIQYGWLWAQNQDGGYDYSLTVQVPNVSAYCETALTSHWALDDEAYAASDAFITQCVSASGVEEFPKENRTYSPLCFSIFRDRVTSVTFKVSAYCAKAMCRWAIFHWGSGLRIWDLFGASDAAVSGATPRQTAFVYDRKTGDVFHVHQYIPLAEDAVLSDQEMERAALANASADGRPAQSAVLHQRGALHIEPGQRLRVNPRSKKLTAEPAPKIARARRPKPRKN
jgi:hypothetical protein